MTSALAVVRFIHFASLLTLFGALSFRGVLELTPKIGGLGEVDRHWSRLVPAITALIGVSAVAWLIAEAAMMSGSWAEAVGPSTLSLVLSETQFGHFWIARLFLAVAMMVTAALGSGAVRPILIGLSGAMLASLGLVGHAAMDEDFVGVVHRVVHGLHLLAAGAWVGGLALLIAVMRLVRAGALLALERFSLYAFAAVVVIIGTGVINGAFLLESWRDLFTSDYGQVLTAKVMVVIVMIGLALAHRFVFLPRAKGRGRASGLFQWSVVVEGCFAIVAIALVSVLGILPPPG